MNLDEMMESTLQRLRSDVTAYKHLRDATESLATAANLIGNTDHPSNRRAFIEAESLEHLAQAQRARMGELTTERATQLGWQVATYLIAPAAKNSGEEALTFIAGNSYMPPLREIGPSEDVWQIDECEMFSSWESYVDGITTRLDELQVYMAMPEGDNSLYVVDLERFQAVDDPDGLESLEGSWRPI
jgi:hypothetical protein